MSDSDSEVFKELLIARWGDRFIAWLIDFIISSAISLGIMASIFGTTSIEWNENTVFSESISYVPASLLFFFYTTKLRKIFNKNLLKDLL